MISKRHEICARETALQLIKELRIGKGANGPTLGFILGTGWEESLLFDEPPNEVLLENLHGFHEPMKTSLGHSPKVVFGLVCGVPIIAQIGRVHLSDPPADRGVQDMVRLQAEMLIHLGVQRLVLACGAGRTDDVFSADNATHETREILTGDVVLINGFLTAFAQNLPGFSSERGSPDLTINWALYQHILAYATESPQFRKRLHTGGYAMITGPYWEGRYDRSLLGLSQVGVKAIGFGLLPEACTASLYRASKGVSTLSIALIINAAERGETVDTPEITETKKLLPSLFRFLIRNSIANHAR